MMEKMIGKIVIYMIRMYKKVYGINVYEKSRSINEGETCSICLGKIRGNEYELRCGHKFHNECIISWFRQKKDTCPCCRDTGMNESQEIIENDWRSHEDVREFLNAENPSKNQIIKAYMMRDKNNEIGINECFEMCVRNLRVNPEKFEEEIKEIFRMEQRKVNEEYIKRCLENPNETNKEMKSINYNKYVVEKLESERYKEKLKIYQTLEKRKNENDHKGIYESIERNDLLFEIGW